MALITWNNKYSVGIEALDNQHKAFMKTLNELHAAAMRGKAQEVADPLLRQALSLASEHFATEERLMESSGFPGLASHRAAHQDFTRKVGEFVVRRKKGDTTVYISMLHFMRDWLTRHMQREDQEYAPWLAARGVK
jgi:hemerythrin-like metal-binding protein